MTRRWMPRSWTVMPTSEWRWRGGEMERCAPSPRPPVRDPVVIMVACCGRGEREPQTYRSSEGKSKKRRVARLGRHCLAARAEYRTDSRGARRVSHPSRRREMPPMHTSSRAHGRRASTRQTATMMTCRFLATSAVALTLLASPALAYSSGAGGCFALTGHGAIGAIRHRRVHAHARRRSLPVAGYEGHPHPHQRVESVQRVHLQDGRRHAGSQGCRIEDRVRVLGCNRALVFEW